MPVRRVHCVVQSLIPSHTYDAASPGQLTEEQQIEVTHAEAEGIIANFKSSDEAVPYLWNHGLDELGNKPIGRVVDVYKDGDSLFAITEQDDDVINEVINNGVISHISMSHIRAKEPENCKIREVSSCVKGRRDGTGTLDIEPIACSTDMSEEMTDAAPQYDTEGYRKFQEAVHKWNEEGVKPEDFDEETDRDIYIYQMNRYAKNTFLDDATSTFLIDQLAKCSERENKLESQRHRERTQLASLASSFAKDHLRSKGARVTPEQVAEAKRRLLQEAPEYANFPAEQLQQLCEVRASIDAQKEEHESTQKAAPPPVAMEVDPPRSSDSLKQLELEVKREELRLEQLKLQRQLLKQENKQEEIKQNAKAERVQTLTSQLQKNSRYHVPETEVVDEPIPKKTRAVAPQPSGIDLSQFLIEPAASSWRYGCDPWGKPGKETRMRTYDEFVRKHAGVLQGVDQKLSKASHIAPGLKDELVMCSSDYMTFRSQQRLQDPLNDVLDKAVLCFGGADPQKRFSDPEWRIRRLEANAGRQILRSLGYQ